MIDTVKSALLSPPGQRDRIKPAAKHGVTAQKPESGKRQALHRAKSGDRLYAVIRTRRIKPATRRSIFRDIFLIKFYRLNQKIFHHKKPALQPTKRKKVIFLQPKPWPLPAFWIVLLRLRPFLLPKFFFLPPRPNQTPGGSLAKAPEKIPEQLF